MLSAKWCAHRIDVIVATERENDIQNSSPNVVPIVGSALEGMREVVGLLNSQFAVQCCKAATDDKEKNEELHGGK